MFCLLTWASAALQKIRTVELDGKVIKLQIVSLALLLLLPLLHLTCLHT
jgi:hypothetical protein